MAPKKDTAKKEIASKQNDLREEKMKALESALAQLNKTYGKGAVMKFGDAAADANLQVIPTGCLELDMALGNVIGSNIFNILLILGLAAVISPVTFIFENMIDIVLLTAMSLLVWIFGWTRQRLCRTEGMVMLAIYAVYLVYICIR